MVIGGKSKVDADVKSLSGVSLVAPLVGSRDNRASPPEAETKINTTSLGLRLLSALTLPYRLFAPALRVVLHPPARKT